ncbi:MAG: aminotransferase class III-fold pyridoxal phosphate-dependent enzyme, partial [Pseudomonadota bacterium]
LSSAYMPLSAAIIPGSMYDELVEPVGDVGVFGHGYTYSGHPVACAVASKVLDIYQRDRVFEHAARMGEDLQTRLASLQDHPLVGEVRGQGLIGAVELVAHKGSKQPFVGNAVGGYCQKQCEERGLILRALGGNSVAICPPLIIQPDQIEELVHTLTQALDATLDHVRREGLLVESL